MRFLLWSALTTVIVLSVCCFIALAVGHQQPPSEPVSILHLNDCAAPCWLGIQPGKTTMREAEERLLAAYKNNNVHAVLRLPDKLLSYEITLKGANQPQIVVTFVGSPIGTMSIATVNHPNWGSPSLGDLFTIYGVPSGVASDRLLYVLLGDSPDQLMIPISIRSYASAQPKKRLLIDETVGMLVFFHQPEKPLYSRWTPWRGFAVLQPHYLSFVVP